MRKRMTWDGERQPLPAQTTTITSAQAERILRDLDVAAIILSKTPERMDVVRTIDAAADIIELSVFGSESVRARMAEFGVQQPVEQLERPSSWDRLRKL